MSQRYAASSAAACPSGENIHEAVVQSLCTRSVPRESAFRDLASFVRCFDDQCHSWRRKTASDRPSVRPNTKGHVRHRVPRCNGDEDRRGNIQPISTSFSHCRPFMAGGWRLRPTAASLPFRQKRILGTKLPFFGVVVARSSRDVRMMERVS